MSGYEKSQEPYVYEAAATRPNQNQSYASFAQPSFASQYPDTQARVSHEPSTEMPFIPTSTYESRGAAYQAQFPFIDARSRHDSGAPEIIHYSPSRGRPGDKLSIHLRANYDLTERQITFFFIMFGSRRCETALTKLDRNGDYFNYALTTDIPPHEVTTVLDGQMELKLNMEDEYGRILDVFHVGDFTYTDIGAYPSYSSSQDRSLKRKYSVSSLENSEYLRSPAKRIYAKPRENSNAYTTSHSSVSPAASYVQASLPASFSYGGYERIPQQQSQAYTHQASNSKGLYAVPSGIGIAQPSIKTQSSPSLPSYSPYSAASQTGRSPASISATPARTPAMPSPASLANPPLIRTSTIQPASTAITPAPGHSQAFNPYAMYPNSKANLKIDGELEKMAEGWTTDEWDAKRRQKNVHRTASVSVAYYGKKEGNASSPAWIPFSYSSRLLALGSRWRRRIAFGAISKASVL